MKRSTDVHRLHQLSDLANLLLPFSISPESIPSDLKERGGSSSLAKGFRGIPEAKMRIPTGDELEKTWVAKMNEGEAWQAQNRAKLEQILQVQVNNEEMGHSKGPRWTWPIKGFDWVRSWMLWRRETFSMVLRAVADRPSRSGHYRAGHLSSCGSGPSIIC